MGPDLPFVLGAGVVNLDELLPVEVEELELPTLDGDGLLVVFLLIVLWLGPVFLAFFSE